MGTTLVASMTEKDWKRFWSKVDQSGGPDACWPWIGGCIKGYGTFSVGGRAGGMVRSSRVACEHRHGPLGELEALHSCDNPPCCNPSHLNPGTRLANVEDCVKKERIARGTKVKGSKLTDSDVPEIRRMLVTNKTQREIAKLYSCHQSVISDIATGKAWTHI